MSEMRERGEGGGGGGRQSDREQPWRCREEDGERERDGDRRRD